MMIVQTVPVDGFYRRVAHVARGCPTEVLRDAVVAAAREFCERTWLWESDLVPVTTQAGVTTYNLFAAQGEILAVKSADLDGEPARFTTPGRQTVRLWDDPGDGRELTVRAVLAPWPHAKDLPDFLFRDWQEAVAASARARLLDMPGTDWFSPELAEKYRLEFQRQWVPRSRVENVYRDRRPLRVRARRFI